MSIEDEIRKILYDLEIAVRLDGDNDLEVTLLLNTTQLSQSYVELDQVFLKIEP